MKDCFETPPMKEEMYLDNYETHLPEVIELSVRGERASSNYLQALELTQTVIKSLEKNDLHEAYSGLILTMQKWDLRLLRDEDLQRLSHLANIYLKKNPEDPEAIFIIGYCRAVGNFNPKHNLKLAEKCLKLNYYDPNFQFNLGMAHAYMESYEMAKHHFRIAMNIKKLTIWFFYLTLCQNLNAKSVLLKISRLF